MNLKPDDLDRAVLDRAIGRFIAADGNDPDLLQLALDIKAAFLKCPLN